MSIPLTSVLEAGVAIRTLRKRAGIRIDDFALTAGVSKQFMTDLENGKATVQMGKVLELLQRLGVKVVLELPESEVLSYRDELSKAQLRRASRQSRKRPELLQVVAIAHPVVAQGVAEVPDFLDQGGGVHRGNQERFVCHLSATWQIGIEKNSYKSTG
jgi:transcriptional regulator with XRE-family HTH domain